MAARPIGRWIWPDAKISVTFFQLGGSGGAIASDRAGFDKVWMPLPLSAVRVDDCPDPDLRRWIVDW